MATLQIESNHKLFVTVVEHLYGNKYAVGKHSKVVNTYPKEYYWDKEASCW